VRQRRHGLGERRRESVHLGGEDPLRQRHAGERSRLGGQLERHPAPGASTSARRISSQSWSSVWSQKSGMQGFPVMEEIQRARATAVAALCSV
jgi:hypothetical protein